MKFLLKSGRYWDPGIDPYSYQRAAEDNRDEVLRSELCGCIACGETFPPSEIRKWWDEGSTACCPRCGMTSVVVGSASGLAIDRESLEVTGRHLLA